MLCVKGSFRKNMNDKLLGLIFSIIWFAGVAVFWFLAFFRGYDKIWSNSIIEFQNQFAFFQWHRRFNKVWNSPLILKIVLTIFVFVGLFCIYLAFCDFYQK